MTPPITPGEILLEEYFEPMGISENAMARAIGVAPRAINEIVQGKRSITPQMSIRFGAFFGQSEEFWHGIQVECDFRALRGKARGLKKQVTPTRKLPSGVVPGSARAAAPLRSLCRSGRWRHVRSIIDQHPSAQCHDRSDDLIQAGDMGSRLDPGDAFLVHAQTLAELRLSKTPRLTQGAQQGPSLSGCADNVLHAGTRLLS